MSMNLLLRKASQFELARFARDGAVPAGLLRATDASADASAPSYADMQRLHTSVGERFLASLPPARREIMRRLVADRMTALQRESARLASPAAGSSAPALDLHKSWHLIHYLLSGEAWRGRLPAATLLTGGRATGPDLGHGPARLASSRDTAEFAAFLAPLGAPALASRLDLPAMRRLGISCVDDTDDVTRAELADDLAHYFPLLQSYVGEAAADGQGLIIWMN